MDDNQTEVTPTDSGPAVGLPINFDCDTIDDLVEFVSGFLRHDPRRYDAYSASLVNYLATRLRESRPGGSLEANQGLESHS